MDRRKHQKYIRHVMGMNVLMLLSVSLFSSYASFCSAEIVDRVVAFVDNQAITLSELEDQHRKTLQVSPEITREAVLNTMIHRILLLREARKYRIEALSKDEIMNEYIDLKIRAFIRVGESEIEAFYYENSDRFTAANYDDVRDEIEAYLTEKKLNEKLKELLRELKSKAYVRVQLYPG